MALWNRNQTPPDSEVTDLAAPAHPPYAPHPEVRTGAPVLPVRTPGAAPAISESAITGSAFAPLDVPAVPFEHVDDQTRTLQAQAISGVFAELGSDLVPDLRADRQPAAPQSAVGVQDEHPLTSADLAFRYSKEKASGVEAGLQHLRARRALSEMSDADLGLVTVPAMSVYDLLCADLGFTPAR